MSRLRRLKVLAAVRSALGVKAVPTVLRVNVASLAKIALAVLIRNCHAAANHALHAKAVPNVLDAKGAVNAPSVCNVWT